uniref:PPPDE domain-containing protein n=1 Tax=Chlamydomonas euryale TaxID=1486919 RepID=A0A6U2FU75_9CHLO|mmetsp:Transcript_30783/g.91527  ORF Transcript_30783/g.91527 Transcript_30783/m.91527 type:complete len:427 (+) Transcript_30783:1042-2322(+)
MARGQEVRAFDVCVNIYDVSRDEGVMTSLNTLGIKSGVGGAFHAGIEVDGLEWSFGHSESGTGMHAVEPREHPSFHFRMSAPLGTVTMSHWQLKHLLKALHGEWEGSRYDKLHLNCCHFCDALCDALGVRRPPRWLNRLANSANTAVVVTHGAIDTCKRLARTASNKLQVLSHGSAPPLSGSLGNCSSVDKGGAGHTSSVPDMAPGPCVAGTLGEDGARAQSEPMCFPWHLHELSGRPHAQHQHGDHCLQKGERKLRCLQQERPSERPEEGAGDAPGRQQTPCGHNNPSLLRRAIVAAAAEAVAAAAQKDASLLLASGCSGGGSASIGLADAVPPPPSPPRGAGMVAVRSQSLQADSPYEGIADVVPMHVPSFARQGYFPTDREVAYGSMAAPLSSSAPNSGMMCANGRLQSVAEEVVDRHDYVSF